MLLRHIDTRSPDWREVEEELADSASAKVGRLLPEEVARLRRLVEAEHLTMGMPRPVPRVDAAFPSPIHFHGGSQLRY